MELLPGARLSGRRQKGNLNWRVGKHVARQIQLRRCWVMAMIVVAGLAVSLFAPTSSPVLMTRQRGKQ